MTSSQSTVNCPTSLVIAPAVATTATATSNVTATSPSESSIPSVPPLPEGPDPYCLGSTFPCLDAFRDALLAHTVHRRLSYKVAKCSWYAYVVTCRDPHCSFKIRGVYARKPQNHAGYQGPAPGPTALDSTPSTPAATVEAHGGSEAATVEEDGHGEDTASTTASHILPHGYDTRTTPVIYPPSNPSDAHPDYHWRVSIAIPHSHNCSQDHTSWKHAISYLKRGGLPARRTAHSRNGFGIGRPRIGGIVIPGPDDPQKLQHQILQHSRYQRLQHQLQSLEDQQKAQQSQRADVQGQHKDAPVNVDADTSVRRAQARPPASKRQKIANPSAVQLVSSYFDSDGQQRRASQLEPSHGTSHAAGGAASHTHANLSGGPVAAAPQAPPQIPAEATFYLLSTLRYDPSFTRNTSPTTSSSTPGAQRNQKSLQSTSPATGDLNASIHQSPYYLLPYHVARLLAGARAFGWTKAVETLSDGYGAGKTGSKNGSLTGLDKLARALDEKCSQGTDPQQQQQPPKQPHFDPALKQGQNADGAVREGTQPLRVRILLSSSGRLEVQTNPLPAQGDEQIFFLEPPTIAPTVSSFSAQPQQPFTFSTLRQMHPRMTPWEVRLDTRSVTPSLFTRHKSTERDVYTAARRRVGIAGPTGMEVLVWNDNGEIMEGSVCSVYFRRPIAHHDERRSAQGLQHSQMPSQYPDVRQQEGPVLSGTNGNAASDNHTNLPLPAHIAPSQMQDDHSPMPVAASAVTPQTPALPLSARDTWVTPPLNSGCNASTTRAYALVKEMCREESVRVDSIVDGEEVWLSNGLRGFVPGVIRFDWAGNSNGAENGIFQ